MMDRWQKQTRFGSPDSSDPGNCWACCIAGLLGISPDDVPEALRLETDDQKRWDAYQEFLRLRGYAACSWTTEKWTEENWNWFWDTIGPALIHVSGDSPRGDWKHGVVYKNGKLFFDPHPSGDGIKSITQIELLVPLDPAGGIDEQHG